MRIIDLHIHTTASDGTDAPGEIVEQAKELGLAAVGITDHDSVGAVGRALEAGEQLGMEVVPGIEVSSDYLDNNVHILGYYIDPAAPELREVLDWAANERRMRNEKIVANLAAAGYDISMEALREAYPDAVLGRPHFCEHLMKKGYLKSVQEGFDTLLGVGCPFYMPKRRIPIARAVQVIRAVGGVPVLAHPLQYGYDRAGVLQLLDTVWDCGIRHLEGYYSEHSAEEEAWLLSQAAERGFGLSGGSDYHGSRKPHIRMGSGMGRLCVPYSVLEGLKAAAGRA